MRWDKPPVPTRQGRQSKTRLPRWTTPSAFMMLLVLAVLCTGGGGFGKVAVKDSSTRAHGESHAQTEVGHSETSMCNLGLQCGPRPAIFYGPCAITIELLRQTKRETAMHRPTLEAAVTSAAGARHTMASVTADDPRCFTAARNVAVAMLAKKWLAELAVPREPTPPVTGPSWDQYG